MTGGQVKVMKTYGHQLISEEGLVFDMITKE